MYACIIMHNMMVESKGRAICTYDETETEKNEQLYIPGSTEFLYDFIRKKRRHVNKLKSEVTWHCYVILFAKRKR